MKGTGAITTFLTTTDWVGTTRLACFASCRTSILMLWPTFLAPVFIIIGRCATFERRGNYRGTVLAYVHVFIGMCVTRRFETFFAPYIGVVITPATGLFFAFRDMFVDTVRAHDPGRHGRTVIAFYRTVLAYTLLAFFAYIGGWLSAEYALGKVHECFVFRMKC